MLNSYPLTDIHSAIPFENLCKFLGSVCSRRRLSAADMSVAIVRKHTYDTFKILQIIKELKSDKTSLEIMKI